MSELEENATATKAEFDALDYAVFSLMLLICTGIGLYFGYEDYRKRKRLEKEGGVMDDGEDYLLGGRDMGVVPIALSLTASFVSGTIILGVATEMYLYGSQYIYMTIAVVICALCLHFVIIPVFHELRITSTYEYLQNRFDKRMRLFGSIVFLIGLNIFLPIVVYVPAFAFSVATKINVHAITPVVMIICIFYTCVGGMKAVVWTDCVQIVILFFTLIFIAIKGTFMVGGLSEVVRLNMESERLQLPDLRIDPTIRHSFFTLVIGGSIFYIAATGLNQNMIQRFMAVKTIKKARIANWINMSCICALIIICCYNGLLMYSMYHDCDIFVSKGIMRNQTDAAFPTMIMEKFHDVPGFAGLFTAGVFAAALSTLSTAYNSMAAVAFEDIVKTSYKGEISKMKTFMIMRGTVFVLGCLSVALVYVAQDLGDLLQLTMTLPATSLGPMLGVFLIGLCIPWLGRRSVFYSAVIVYFTMLVVVILIQTKVASGEIWFDKRVTSIEGCPTPYNFTIPETTPAPQLDLQTPPHKSLSYLYFVASGCIAVVLLSTIFSVIFGFEDPKKVNPRLLAPFLRKYINSEFKAVEDNEQYENHVEIELKEVKNSEKL